MLIEFFLKLREGGVPVSIREFLTLNEALQKEVVFGSVEDFYYLARTSSSRIPNDHFGIIQRGLAIGV